MDDFRFNSLNELFKKLLPALNTKISDLKRSNIRYITTEDLWLFLRKTYWSKATKLTLGEMVNDILSAPNEQIEDFVLKTKRKKETIKNNEIL